MKKYALILSILLLFPLCLSAQERQKFSPEKFEADMQEFITREAALDQKEAAKFFPLLNEMHQKQRALFGQIRKASKDKPADNKAAAQAIKQCDKLNIELKQIEQQYHEKMLKELPAQIVDSAINAEGRFHRKMMSGWHNFRNKQRDKRH